MTTEADEMLAMEASPNETPNSENPPNNNGMAFVIISSSQSRWQLGQSV